MNERGRRWARLSGLPLLAVAMLLPASAYAATADLAVDKSDSPDPVTEGKVLTYTIDVSNAGPGAASDVTLTDTLPSHVDFISATPTQGNCDHSGNRVTCHLGTLPADPYNPVAGVTIKVRPKKAGQISNAATVAVGPSDNDPVNSNNTDTETTRVIAAGGGGGGGPTCAGHAATIVGNAGANTLIGTSGRDVIVARRGNDVVRGRGGNDLVCAGRGRDLVKGGSGNDKLKGGRGRDRLRGGSGDDDMFGGPGRDTCRGGAGHDTEHSC
jgi:uncharacterized repeat protein (TIGR01451 family)